MVNLGIRVIDLKKKKNSIKVRSVSEFVGNLEREENKKRVKKVESFGRNFGSSFASMINSPTSMMYNRDELFKKKKRGK